MNSFQNSAWLDLPIGFTLKDEPVQKKKVGPQTLFRPVQRQPVFVIGTSDEKFSEWLENKPMEGYSIVLRWDSTLTFLTNMCKVLTKEPGSASSQILISTVFETHLGKSFLLRAFLQTVQQKINECFETFQCKVILIHVPITMTSTISEAMSNFMEPITLKIFVNEMPKSKDLRASDWFRLMVDEAQDS